MKKRTFSTIGIALLVSLFALQGFASAITGIIAFVAALRDGGTAATVGAALGSVAKLNGLLSVIGEVLALIIFRFMTKALPKGDAPKETLSARNIASLTLASYGISMIFALLGSGLNRLLRYLATGEISGENTELVANLLSQSPLLFTILFVGIGAPILEELIFRMALIDILRPFGYKVSLLISGLLFGAFHMNFEQFFYAFLIGVILGAVYYKTNEIKYTMIIHIAFNSFNVLISGLAGINESAIVILQYLLITLGLFLFFTIGIKYLRTRPVEAPVEVTKKEMFINPGMLAFLVCCLLGMLGTGLIL